MSTAQLAESRAQLADSQALSDALADVQPAFGYRIDPSNSPPGRGRWTHADHSLPPGKYDICSRVQTLTSPAAVRL